jgi:ribonuclease VapC
MTVVFDAEPLLAFSFDERGASEVERWLDRVYDGDVDGYISTINLAEFRYVAIRNAAVEQADTHINHLLDMGVTTYDIDDRWNAVSDIKATYSPSIGDAYAVATARDLADDGRDVTLLVGADDDYDVFEEAAAFGDLVERFRTDPATD